MPIIISHRGDPEKALRQQQEFFECLGRAISQWAYVEDQVYHTYRVIIDPGDWIASAAAYHSVINMKTRLDMIDAALSVSRHYKHRLSEWEKIRKKIGNQSVRRNKVAHWTVTHDATQDDEPGVTMYLQAPLYDFRKISEEGHREKIDTKQVVQWAGAFAKLGLEIEDFWRSLKSK
jgi:hypothetical protein